MKYFWAIVFVLVSFPSIAQIMVEGYVFESGNRGFISGATVQASDAQGQEVYAQAVTDRQGGYRFSLPEVGDYLLTIVKLPFVDHQETISTGSSDGVVYLKHEIVKKPGYVFEITLAEKDPDPNAYRTGLQGALVEVYNNTQKREELIIEKLENPEFKVDFTKGNHYTILIRKEGFLAKRMEAFVDVEGCILCFEGVGEVTPGVTDNLTAANSRGVLLANVEMDRYFQGKVIGVNDIYYDTNESKITRKGAEELNKVAGFIKDNPDITLELGSHTDSRGKTSYNQALSEKRANAAVKYLTQIKGVSAERLAARGYGESLLTNHCAKGVKCKESEHAVNRRTELKVLHVSTFEGRRSLRQMKTEELMDEILLDLQSEGEVRVTGDSNLDEVLDKRSEDKESGKDISTTTNTINRPKDNNPVVTADNKPQAEIPMTTPPHRESAPALQKAQILEDTEETPQVSDVTPPSQTYMAESDPHRYSATYSGYKIVLIFSRYALSQDHPLYTRFKQLDVYTTADGNRLYMIESYATRREAERRLKQRFITSFPKAYVVGFADGIITD